MINFKIQKFNKKLKKKRIKKFPSQQINIQYSYTLPKIGIVIHTETEKEAEILEKEINNIFPGSSCAKSIIQASFTKVIIKVKININLCISTEDIKQFVDRKCNQNLKIKRFYLSVNRKPIPIISISCYFESNSVLLTEGIDIFETHYHCKKYKKSVFHFF